MYPQSMFEQKNKKIIKKFHVNMNIFTAVKYCCILHGRVCVMCLEISAILTAPEKTSLHIFGMSDTK